MAGLFQGLFGKQPEPVKEDDDFADFAHAPQPEPAKIKPVTPDAVTSLGSAPTADARIPIVYTRWYRVWERTQLSDFYPELTILPFMFFLIALHVWGRKANKKKAKAWIEAHGPLLQKEYAQVGYEGKAKANAEAAEGEDSAAASTGQDDTVDLKENTAQEFSTYCTGRQNVAFSDVKLTLYKRYNPATWAAETILGSLFDGVQSPSEKVDITTYAFDGREKDVIPPKTPEHKELIEAQSRSKSSTYDAFVWAVVHKDKMKKLRDDRYDISLTVTRDHDKLPPWCAVMSESAEITEKLLTDDLAKALKEAGEDFAHLILTDQPIDKPASLDETKMRKRLALSLSLPSSNDSSSANSLLSYFLRLPDILVSTAHFRPEVRRKIEKAREEEQKKISKADEEEKSEERRLEAEKKKKEIRDQKMRGMSADEQRKFLDKERERQGKKMEKRSTKKVQG